MQRVLLDTDILSEYLKGYDQNVIRRAKEYAETHTRFTFTSVTAYEIVFGLEAKGATRQVANAIRWIEDHDQVLPIESDYLTAAKVKASARKLGSTIELPDCLIGAVASRLSLTLVTGNTEDFEAMRRAGLVLKLEDWRA